MMSGSGISAVHIFCDKDSSVTVPFAAAAFAAAAISALPPYERQVHRVIASFCDVFLLCLSLPAVNQEKNARWPGEAHTNIFFS